MSYSNLQFTHELQVDNPINFLDVTLNIKNKKIISNWFQNSTSSGRLINYFSSHPIQQKINIVYHLIDRAILLSHDSFHKDNLTKVKQILNNNDYPSSFFN